VFKVIHEIAEKKRAIRLGGPILLGGSMTSAFVRPKTGNYFALTLDKESYRNTPSGWGVELLRPLEVIGLTSKEPIDDLVLKAGQKVILDFGTVSKNKFQMFIEPNPILHTVALVSGPTMLEPEQKETPLFLVLRAEKQINLEEIPWLLKIFLVD